MEYCSVTSRITYILRGGMPSRLMKQPHREQQEDKRLRVPRLTPPLLGEEEDLLLLVERQTTLSPSRDLSAAAPAVWPARARRHCSHPPIAHLYHALHGRSITSHPYCCDGRARGVFVGGGGG